MNNIVLVCDDKSVSEKLKSNLMLLRKFDYIYSCDFLSAEIAIEQNRPQLIIIYSKDDDYNVLQFIKSIKSIPVFFVTDEITDEKILNVFEAGAIDYVSLNQSQTEFLVRVMSCFKRATSEIRASLNEEILTQIGILKKGTVFYSAKYTPAVFKNLVKEYLKSKIKVCVMGIAPDINVKNRCSLEYLASLLKENLRDDDVIGFGKDVLYVILKNTNTQGALNVYNKIKPIISDSYTISAGVVELKIKDDVNYVLKNVDMALEDALMLTNSVVVQEDFSSSEASNWLDRSNKKHKSFKLFKKAFIKKLETVVVPVFYQKQQLAEQRLFETKVEQYTIENKCIFSLEKNGIKSVLEITYPGAIKINIDETGNINDVSSAPERFSCEISQLNEKMLGEKLDKFIRKFQKLYG